MGRILGVDFGSRRVGLALSDPGCVIAFPFRTLQVVDPSELVKDLVTLIGDLEVGKVVVGFPLGLKGQQTDQTAEVRKFVSVLRQRVSVPVDTVDERLTTVEATRSLQRQGFKPSREKHLIDETAAAILLQAYLDSQTPS